MAKNIWLLLMVLVMFIGAGCIGPSTPSPPEVEIHIRWGGLTGFIPGVNNNLGVSDQKKIEVTVENKEAYGVEGMKLEVYHNIQNFKVNSDSAFVIPLGPEGTSRTKPNIFVFETLNTPPGNYPLYLNVMYNGEVIKIKQLELNIG